MKSVEEYISLFQDGFKTHEKAYAIMKKYGKPCKEAAIELREAGITQEKWDRLNLFSDMSLEGIAYSLGGTASWIKSGMPD